jgi:hypothetical protein
MSAYVTKRGMRMRNPAKKVRRMKRGLASLGIDSVPPADMT